MPTGTQGVPPKRGGEVGTQPRNKKGWDTVATTGDKEWSSTTKKQPLKKHKVGKK